MSEDEFYKTAEVVKLETLSDVNDIGKPWRYEEDGLTVTRTSPCLLRDVTRSDAVSSCTWTARGSSCGWRATRTTR